MVNAINSLNENFAKILELQMEVNMRRMKKERNRHYQYVDDELSVDILPLSPSQCDPPILDNNTASPDTVASPSADADVDIAKNIQNPVVAIIQEVYCSFYLFLISLQKIQEIPLYIKEIPEEEHEKEVITQHVKAKKRKSKRNKNSNKNNPTNGNNNQTSNNRSSNKNNLTKDNNNLNSNNPKTQKDRQQWLKNRIDDKKTPKNRKDEYITQLEQLRLTD